MMKGRKYFSSKNGVKFRFISKLVITFSVGGAWVYFWVYLWHHNFCPWCHQHNFIIWIKLYCRFSHATSLLTPTFLWEELWQPQFLWLALKFYTSLTERLKLKLRKFWGLISKFVGVTGEKTWRGPFCLPSPHARDLNRIKGNIYSYTRSKNFVSTSFIHKDSRLIGRY